MAERIGRVALVGLPRTGKSTYLGALWQLIQDPHDDSIAEVDVTGDRSYLQLLGERVAQLQEIDRTDVASDEGLRLVVRFRDKGDVELDVPDLSGETLRLLVEERVWHDLVRDAVESADAILLFVHPDRLRLPIRTNFTDAALADLVKTSRDGAETVDASNAGLPEGPLHFAPRYACTAAKLVDAIENIVAGADSRRPIRIGIVLSAWDEIDSAPTPREWLGQELPAVARMCSANAELVELGVFGVSALGGRIPKEKERLLKLGGVFERAYARDADGRAVPLCRPLEWALSW